MRVSLDLFNFGTDCTPDAEAESASGIAAPKPLPRGVETAVEAPDIPSMKPFPRGVVTAVERPGVAGMEPLPRGVETADDGADILAERHVRKDRNAGKAEG